MATRYLIPVYESHYVCDCFNLEEFLEKRKEFENKMMLEYLARFFTSGLIKINKELQKYYQFKWLTMLDIDYHSNLMYGYPKTRSTNIYSKYLL